MINFLINHLFQFVTMLTVEGDPPTPSVNGEPPETPPVAKTYSVEDVNRAAANARKEAEAKLKDSTDRLTILEAEQTKRDELELSEIDKLKKVNDEQTLEVDRLKAFETKDTERTAKLTESFDKKLEESELTDEDKELFDGLPIDKKLSLLAKLTATPTTPIIPGSTGSYPGTTNPTKEKILAMKSGPEKSAEWRKYRDAGGV